MSDYCLIAEPIYASPQDTVETLQAIERHNDKWFGLCE